MQQAGLSRSTIADRRATTAYDPQDPTLLRHSQYGSSVTSRVYEPQQQQPLRATSYSDGGYAGAGAGGGIGAPRLSSYADDLYNKYGGGVGLGQQQGLGGRSTSPAYGVGGIGGGGLGAGGYGAGTSPSRYPADLQQRDPYLPADRFGGSGSSIADRGYAGSSVYDRYSAAGVAPSDRGLYGGHTSSLTAPYSSGSAGLLIDRYTAAGGAQQQQLQDPLYGNGVSAGVVPRSSSLSIYDNYDRGLPLGSAAAYVPSAAAGGPSSLYLQQHHQPLHHGHHGGHHHHAAQQHHLQQQQQLHPAGYDRAVPILGSQPFSQHQQPLPHHHARHHHGHHGGHHLLGQQQQSLYRPSVLVVGASGNIGEATVRALCEKFGHKLDIRAGVRDVAAAQHKFGNLQGLQIVHADMSHPQTLGPVMHGVERVFCVVPPNIDRTQYAINCANACVQHGVRFLLMLSVLSVEATHTIFAQQFAPIEAHVKNLPILSAIIRLPMFFENNFGNKQSIQAQSTIYGPLLPNSRFTMVAVKDVGECAAQILSDPDSFNGRIYKLVAPSASSEELAIAFSAALGRPIKYQNVSYEQARESLAGMGLQPHQVNGALELMHLIDANSPLTNETHSHDIESILRRPPTSLQQWVHSVAPAFQQNQHQSSPSHAQQQQQAQAQSAAARSPQPQTRMPVLVVGATGNIGEATIRALSEKYSHLLDIRAGVRDVNAARSKFHNLQNVQFVHADMNQPQTLVAAMQGVDRVFCVVPPTQDRTHLAINCANACVQARVRFLLMLSVLTAEAPGTIFSQQFAPIEAHVKTLHISSAIIRLPMFFENNFGNKQSIQGQSTIYGPLNPHARSTQVSVKDVGECAAKILSDPGPYNGRIFKLVAPSMSSEDLAQAFSAALGRPIKYQQVSFEQARQSLSGMGLQPHQVNGVLELLYLIDSNSPLTNEQDTRDIEFILHRPATTIIQWAHSVRQAFAQ